MYKVERGIADESHGISVAKLAGLPSQVTDVAQMYKTKTFR